MTLGEQFRQLSERPWLVAALALALLALLGWGWQSVNVRRERLERSVVRERALVAWMEQAAREVKTLRRASAGRLARDARRSVLSVVNTTAAGHAMATRIKRVEPQGENGVRLWVAAMPFDALVQWLGQLHQDYRIEVADAEINSTKNAGSVDATLTLKRQGP